MIQQQQLPRQIKHKTLSAYFARLYRLEDLLSPQCPTLLQPSDAQEYKTLLTNAICGVREELPEWPERREEDLYGTQQEIIDRMLLDIARRRRDVLLSMDRHHDPDMPINTARPGVETRHANSPAAVLRSMAFKVLRSRLGDAGFRHLLLHTSLFLPSGNNCFLQLSGAPVYDLYVHSIPAAPGRPGKDSTQVRTSRKRKQQGSSNIASTNLTKRAKTTQTPAEVDIPRQSIFYGHPVRKPSGKHIVGLPPQHVLNRAKIDADGQPRLSSCMTLMQEMLPSLFGLPTFSAPKSNKPSDEPKLIRNPARAQCMIGIMNEVILRHRKLNYGHVLRTCVGQRVGCTTLRPVAHHHVRSTCNQNTAISHAQRVIEAKQFEALHLHSLTEGIKETDISWLYPPSPQRVSAGEASKRKALLSDLIYWIFAGFLVPLLRNSFYATETSATRYETVYYLHDEWYAASRPHLRQLEEDLLEEIPRSEQQRALEGPLGVSAVRLVPKANKGFRPIVNLGRYIKSQTIPGMPTVAAGKLTTANQVLRGVHQVLTFEKDRQKSVLGSSLMGTNEIFTPLQQYKHDLLQRHGRLPQLYFVKTDIRAAFDSINQDKMLAIIADLLDNNHDYCLMLYALLLPPASKASQGSSRRLFKTRALIDDSTANTFFGEQAAEIAKPLRNAIIVDLVRRRRVSRKACIALLRTHIKSNVWQVDRRLLRQKTGIPQGSKISSLLCSFFYAAMERDYLRWIGKKPGSTLMRYIDDFLFVSDERADARRFVEQMQTGFPEYGAFVSPGKTVVSFEGQNGLEPLACDDFPYCGYLINTVTLDVSMDFPRLLSGPVRQSFALRTNRRRGRAFLGWFSRQLENRNHVAYLDTAHNDEISVYRNVFLNFALTALKIPFYYNTDRPMSEQQSQTMFEALEAAVEYTYAAGRARVRHASRLDEDTDHFSLRKVDFEYLATRGIVEALQYQLVQPRLKSVLSLLRSSLAGKRYRSMEEKHDPMIVSVLASVRICLRERQ